MHCQFVPDRTAAPDRMSNLAVAGRRASRPAPANDPARPLLSTGAVSRLAALAVLLFPVASLAQTITVFTDATNTQPVNIGKAACDENRLFVFRWNLNATPLAGDVVKIFITKDTATCSGTSDPTTAPSPPLIQPTSVQASDQASGTAQQLLLDLPGGCANADHKASSPYSVFFCVRRTTNTTLGGSTLTTGNLPVNFALVPPSPPTAPAITEGDSHLVLDWTTTDNSAQSYDVYAFPHGTPADASRPTRTNLVTTHADIDHDSLGNPLVNGQDYDLYVRATDAYGNDSNLSTPTTDHPVQIDDFYNHYRNEGGSAAGGGGCASGGGAGALAVLGLAAVLRRRRRAAAAGAVLLAATPALAADWTGFDRPPRRWLVAVKIDRYDPQIDTQAGLTGTPYHDIFHGRAPPRYQLEVDYQAFHPFGAILLGGTIGFWQNVGKGLLHDTQAPSQDNATLQIVPFGLIVTYRFDWLADRFRWFPFVPYAQAGLQAALWESLNGTGNVSTRPSGGRGSGWSYGYTTALGVAVDLSAIDLDLAREAYVSIGIQRTSLFAEYGWTRLDDFHKSGTLILSDRAWRFGLSVEF
jgi:uncharacterized protein (TIGR03382 family)